MRNNEFTFEDLSKHNTKNDCWIVLYGNVYDITEYMNIHPGNYFPLQVSGKDGSGLFESIHPKKTKNLLNSNEFKNKYYKGYIKNYNILNNFDYNSKFGIELKDKIEKYFESVKYTNKASIKS